MKSLSWKSFAGLLGLLVWSGVLTAAQAAGKIAFVSERDGNREIYVMNSDGSGQTNLTNTPSRAEIDPDFSPDGGKIVYGDGEDLWLMNSSGAGQTRITTDRGRKLEPDYHPDGSKFLFSRSDGSDWDIFTIPPANDSATKIIDNPSGDYEGSWSPDGKKIVFKTFPGSPYPEEIFLCNADGSGQVRLTSTGGNNRPEFSPDGSKIVFESKRDSGNRQIYVMNLDGSNQTRLTKNGFNDAYPTWSPDGSQIAFVSDRSGNNEIYTMNADGSNVVRLTSNSSNDYHPTWSGSAPPRLSLSGGTIPEGDSGTTNLNFTASLSFASTEPVSFTFTTVGGTATAGTDYTDVNTTVVIPAGQTQATISVPVLADPQVEGQETVLARVTNVVGAVSNLQLPDRVVVRNPNNGHVYEIVTDTTNMFTFSAAKAGAESRAYLDTPGHLATINDQAEQDFLTPLLALGYYRLGGFQEAGAAEPGGFSWVTGEPFTFTNWRDGEPNNAGQVENTIITFDGGEWNDIVDTDLAESYIVEFDVNATAFPTALEAKGTITDDDIAGQLSIADITVSEGDANSQTANFTVTLSAPSAETVSVHYATADSSAKVDTDYTKVEGELTFEPGETEKTVSVPILDDLVDEEDETFKLVLSAPVNATLQSDEDTGTAKIIDNDPSPSVSIVPTLTLYEGRTAETQPGFTITLSEASARTVIVKCYTTDIKAKAPSDYTKTTVTLTFAPGETMKVFQIPIINDAFNEASETFKVSVAAVSRATVGVKDSIATIIDDDGVPSFSINDVSVTESDADTIDATFTIQLSAPSSRPISVKYVTADGTALAGSDYTSIALRQLDFAPREMSKIVKIKVRRDFIDEPKEQFFLKLSAPVNATIRDGSGTGTIIDDDAAPSISINSPKISEGNGGTKNLTFTVKLVRLSTRAVTVNYKTTTLATASYRATSGIDYEMLPTGTLTFAPGQSLKTITVKIKGDALDEEDETFAVVLSQPANATLGEPVGIGTIIDDDAAPAASINDVTAVEGNGTYTSARFTVTLSGNVTGRHVAVNYVIKDDTATAATDYVAGNGSGVVNFAPGETQKIIEVQLKGDTVPESKERFQVILVSSTGCTLGKKTGVASILDDDSPAADTSTKTF